jgi:hypothetical protein
MRRAFARAGAAKSTGIHITILTRHPTPARPGRGPRPPR